MQTSRGVLVWTELTRGAAVTLAVALAVWDSHPARASQEEAQAHGSAVFKTYCASCHGREAKGDGPIAQHLRTMPPDLTKLALRNKGKFEADKVYRIIDGREPVKGHGGADMPVWGDAFKQSRENYSEEKVKARIEALVKYLESVQLSGERP